MTSVRYARQKLIRPSFSKFAATRSYFRVQQLSHWNIFTFWSIGVGFHALQCWYSTPQRIFKFACPKNSNCENLPSCPGSRLTITEFSVTLSTLMKKMLNFGERGHHNISHNFGSQHMRRFRLSNARKNYISNALSSCLYSSQNWIKNSITLGVKVHKCWNFASTIAIKFRTSLVCNTWLESEHK
jgi:hypothetical protein